MTPQCTEQWQLHEHMARVLKMCKEAGFDRPWECVKFADTVCTHINLDYMPEHYEFALAIVEGRPVFRGDVLYPKVSCYQSFVPVSVDSQGILHSTDGVCFSTYGLSWNPPQRTIEINGVKVKAPLSVEGSDDAEHPERHGVFITFKEYEDAEAFKAALEGKKNG